MSMLCPNFFINFQLYFYSVSGPGQMDLLMEDISLMIKVNDIIGIVINVIIRYIAENFVCLAFFLSLLSRLSPTLSIYINYASFKLVCLFADG